VLPRPRQSTASNLRKRFYSNGQVYSTKSVDLGIFSTAAKPTAVCAADIPTSFWVTYPLKKETNIFRLSNYT
jgi:hypothetical protein